MTQVPDLLHDIVAACERLRQELEAQQARMETLERENEELRKQFLAVKQERDEFHQSICWLMTRDERPGDEEGWRKTIEEAGRNPGDLNEIIRELEDAEGNHGR